MTEKPQITQINENGPVLLAGVGSSSLDSGSDEFLRTGGCNGRFDTIVVILRGIMTTL
jgi:hypothetical protein